MTQPWAASIDFGSSYSSMLVSGTPAFSDYLACQAESATSDSSLMVGCGDSVSLGESGDVAGIYCLSDLAGLFDDAGDGGGDGDGGE